MTQLLSSLEKRGLIHDASDRDALATSLEKSSLTFYCGFDPTSSSLHVGSLLPITMMKRLQNAGHKPLALIGSGTGMIGDPSGKSEERVLQTSDQVAKNITGIETQLQNLLNTSEKTSCKTVANGDWLSQLDLIGFLRDVGKHFSVNSMMAKDSVKSRLENREQGISYTEFSYMLLQAYDFFHLWKNHDCSLQIGGSDQWGNITEGIELIRRLSSSEGSNSSRNNNAKALGFTFPLLTTSAGTKFGKTAKGAVWLDPTMTSPYEFYQFWINSQDDDVENLLRMFSFKEIEDIENTIKEHQKDKSKRLAQTTLTEELTTFVHGEDEVRKSAVASKVFFGGSIEQLSADVLSEVLADVPSSSLPATELKKDFSIVDLLVHCKMEKSKSAARRLVDNGGVYLNNIRVESPTDLVSPKDLIEDKLLLLRSGKKKYHLVEIS